MSFILSTGGMPKAFAASICPLSIPLIPALIISETYAPEFKENATTPETNMLILIPSKLGKP